MRNKILIISTRKIFEKDTIFENAKRCNETSDSLKKYFVDYLNSRIRSIGTKDDIGNDITLESMPTVIQDYLKEKNACFIDADSNTKSESTVQVSNDLSNEQIGIIQNSLKYFLQPLRQKISRSLNEDKRGTLNEILAELSKQFNKENNEEKQKEIETFVRDIKELLKLFPEKERTKGKNSRDTSLLNIEMKYDDIEKYLDYDAVNIDKEIGFSSSPASANNLKSNKLTIKDRVSFYKILSEEENDVNYTIYAVWPLGHRDKPRISKDRMNLPCWIDRLTDDFAVEENKQQIVDSNKDTILLLLHDNDIKEWKETPFKTVFANQSYSCVDRSLAVFQHSNNFFLNIVNHGDGAKKIIEHAETVIVNDWYVYYLKDLSDYLSSYTGNADDKVFESKLNQVKEIFKRKQDKDFLRNCYLLAQPGNKVEKIYDANLEINKMIKELRSQ